MDSHVKILFKIPLIFLTNQPNIEHVITESDEFWRWSFEEYRFNKNLKTTESSWLNSDKRKHCLGAGLCCLWQVRRFISDNPLQFQLHWPHYGRSHILNHMLQPGAGIPFVHLTVCRWLF